MSQEPLETTQPIELHQADTPEETPTDTDTSDEAAADGTGE